MLQEALLVDIDLVELIKVNERGLWLLLKKISETFQIGDLPLKCAF
jgi:hypothetical protein